MPRRIARLCSATAAAAVLVAAGSPAFAAPKGYPTGAPSGSALGGTQLAGKGTVVSYGPGAAKLPKLPDAGSFVLADLDSGQVLAARNPHGEYLPASTLKVLTALTLIPRIDPATMITPTYEDTAVDGSRVGIVEHFAYSADDLFRAMLMVSGNDAALALTHPVGGEQVVIGMMNDEAKHLNALDTSAKTVNGLDAAGEHSSAYDLALIGRAALQLPAFQTYVTTKIAQFPAPPEKPKPGKKPTPTKSPTAKGATPSASASPKPAPPSSFQIYTHDHLLLNYAGALGIKNGYTVTAHATFVGAAQRNGHRLIVTLMHDQPLAWRDAAALLDWGFANEGKVTPVGSLVDPVAPPAQPTSPASAASAPAAAGAPGGSTTAEAASPKAAAHPMNTGLFALVGGIGGGVLLALIVAIAATRRRRIPGLDVVPVAVPVEKAPRGRRKAKTVEVEDIAVPVAAEPTFTSNIRVRRDTD